MNAAALAHRFALRFVEDKRQDEIERERKSSRLEGLTRQQKVTPITPNRGCTPYGEFEKLAKQIEEDEKDEEEATRLQRELAEGADAQRRALLNAYGCNSDHSKERQVYEKSTTEKLKTARRYKDEGNELFAEQNYGLAACRYRQALVHLDYTFPDLPQDEENFQQIKLSAHLNLAACKLKLEDYDEVEVQCRLALVVDPKSTKAFYRRGVALLEQGEYDKARRDLEKAAELAPSNSSVKSTIERLDLLKEEFDRQSIRVTKAMWSGVGIDGDVAECIPTPPTTSPQPAVEILAETSTTTAGPVECIPTPPTTSPQLVVEILEETSTAEPVECIPQESPKIRLPPPLPPRPAVHHDVLGQTFVAFCLSMLVAVCLGFLWSGGNVESGLEFIGILALLGAGATTGIAVCTRHWVRFSPDVPNSKCDEIVNSQKISSLRQRRPKKNF